MLPVCGFVLIVIVAALALQFLLKLRSLRSPLPAEMAAAGVDRYRPMLRLLSDEDLAFLAVNPKLQRTVRAERRALFRGYLRCLTRDYAQLLAGVRLTMVQSGVDRPDLTRALAKSRLLFAWTMCLIDLRLVLHAGGIGTVDISGLVDAMEVLRAQVRAFAAAPQTA